MDVPVQPPSNPSGHRWWWAGVIGTVAVLVAVGGVVVLLARGGSVDAARQALIDQCRRDDWDVYLLPPPVPAEITDSTEFTVMASTDLSVIRELDASECGSVVPIERLEGSPPSPDPDSAFRSEFGWYRVRHSDGEGWMHFGIAGGEPYFRDDDDREHDAEVRDVLSALPVATFPTGTGTFDLEVAMRTLQGEGDRCVTPGMQYAQTSAVDVSNVGSGVGPATLEVGFGASQDAIDRVETLELLRGLEPGEALTIGPVTSGVVVIDPNGRLDESDLGNNIAHVSSATLVCS